MDVATTEFPVVKGVPVPVIARHVRGGTKYPFALLEVGDYFPASRAYSTLSKALRRYLNMPESKGKHFVIRKLGQSQAWGVWRVK